MHVHMCVQLGFHQFRLRCSVMACWLSIYSIFYGCTALLHVPAELLTTSRHNQHNVPVLTVPVARRTLAIMYGNAQASSTPHALPAGATMADGERMSAQRSASHAACALLDPSCPLFEICCSQHRPTCASPNAVGELARPPPARPYVTRCVA
jgi:hypothetical protein